MPLNLDLTKQRDEKVATGFIIEAVSYRIPLQVTRFVKLPAYGHIYPQCPRCKNTMDREYMRFCDRCGQKLNWDCLDHAAVLYAPFTE